MTTAVFNVTESRWNLFVKQVLRIGLIWLAGVALFTLFRLFYLVYFADNIQSEIPVTQWFSALKTAFAFDSSAAAIFMAIPFLANCFLQPLRQPKIAGLITRYFAYFFFVVVISLCVTSIIYISEYGTQFNYFVFEGLYDDQLAIFKTVLDQYKPWGSIASLVLLIAFFIWYSRYVCQLPLNKFNNKMTESKKLRVVITTLIVILFVCAARGSFESRPIKRKWSAVTQDNFVNELVMNPFRSMAYAYKDYKLLFESGNGSTNPYGQFELSNLEQLKVPLSDKGLAHKPSHVFLIVMESYDSWPLQPKYKNLGLTPELSRLADNGLYFPAALPAASSTFNSLSSIVSGIPYSGINVSRMNYSETTSAFNLIDKMESLGYSSQFFYGGLMSWQQVGSYMSGLGIDELSSAINAGGKGSAGVWGIDDEQLFKLVEKEAKEDSFNVILSTSYHGPFNLDLSESGYPYQSTADYPEDIQALSDNLLDPHILGHLWYSDRALGQFVSRMQRKHPNALFVITGDHYSRRYLHARPSLFELTHVPILFYGKGIEADNKGYESLASHLDIMPTLVDLIDPKADETASFGQSLLGNNNRDSVVGFKTLRTQEAVYKAGANGDFNGEHFSTLYPQQHLHQKLPSVQFNEKGHYKTYMGAAWYLIMNRD